MRETQAIEGLDLESFFRQYAQAFSGRDVSGVAECYIFPAAIYLEDGSLLLLSVEDFNENASQLMAQYSAAGMRSVEYALGAVKPLDQSRHLVAVEWLLLDSNGAKLVEFETQYIVNVADNNIQIMAVFMLNEREALSSLSKK